MRGITGGLAAIFDGDKGAVLSVVLIVLVVVGAILLVVNLSMKPPAPKWEHVADDTPATPAPAAKPPVAPRRRA